MFNKKLKEQLSKAQRSSDFWERKFREIQNELDTQIALKQNYIQLLKKEKNKQNVENYTINLDVSSIDINELTRKIIENINKGRY